RLRAEHGSRHREQLGAGVVGGEAHGRRHGVGGVAAAGARAFGPAAVADVGLDVGGLQPELLGHHHRHRGAEAGADVLRAGEVLHAAVAMDPHLGADAAAARDDVPVAVGHPDPALLGAGSLSGLLVPALPADGLGADVV